MASDAQKLGAIIILAIVIYYLFISSGNPTWSISIAVSPPESGNTNPSGNVSMPITQGLTVTVYPNQDMALDYWNLDGSIVGSTPTVIVANQTKNSNHTLTAFLIPKVPTFEITPKTMAFTPGQKTYFILTLMNNGNFSIMQVRIRLNDPYGVFKGFIVYTHYSYDGYRYYYFFDSILNRFNTEETIMFGGNRRDLQAHSSGNIQCGGQGGGFGGSWKNCEVSATIPAGTYELSFDVTFTSSDPSAPPMLHVPWTVIIFT